MADCYFKLWITERLAHVNRSQPYKKVWLCKFSVNKLSVCHKNLFDAKCQELLSSMCMVLFGFYQVVYMSVESYLHIA